MKTKFLLILLVLSSHAFAQSVELAEEYLNRKEYQKAKQTYQPYLYQRQSLRRVFPQYMELLLILEQHKELEQYITTLQKKHPNNLQYTCALSYLYHKEGNRKKYQKNNKAIIDQYSKTIGQVNTIIQYLEQYHLYDVAIDVVKAFRSVQKSNHIFELRLAKLYLANSQKDLMIDEYVDYSVDKGYTHVAQRHLQEDLTTPEDFQLLEDKLLERIQEDPEQQTYVDLIMWLYIQQKEFSKAYIQARSLDRRLKTEGKYLLEVAQVSISNQDYKVAQKCCQYIIDKFPNSTRVNTAYRYLIKAKSKAIKESYPIDKDAIKSLIQDYQVYFGKVGRTPNTAIQLSDMALLYGLHLDQKDSAIALLNQAIKLTTYRPSYVAQYKIHLGDIYLLQHQPWEASLYYSQAEKMVKNTPIAHIAKLKNAKLNYYKGHFKLALSHLDALKIATSKEIANDAMDLALLIRDNTGKDSTNAALKAYSNVELLLFENKDSLALQSLDSMIHKYKGDPIIDEIYWLKGNTYYKMKAYDKALEMFETITKEYRHDIHGDNAHFITAKIYEENLKDKEKAMTLYKDHLVQFPGSIFCEEARKRYRRLRGDQQQ